MLLKQLQLLLLLSVLISAAFAAEETDGEDGTECSPGEVRFKGVATFNPEERPQQLQPAAVLTIEVVEETPAAAAAAGEERPAIYTHSISLEKYTIDDEVPYSFCADLHGVRTPKISLKAKVTTAAAEAAAEAAGQPAAAGAAGEKVECIGETVVAAGSDAYEADISLAAVDSSSSNNGEPSVADCNFTVLSEDVMGIAVKAAVSLPPSAAAPRSSSSSSRGLPKPTFLVVTLKEREEETGEPEVISVFSGDVSSIYEENKPLPAFLCAKIPSAAAEEAAAVSYTLEATAFIGWEGYVEGEEERQPRKGDYVTPEPIEININSNQRDYSLQVALKPYKP